MDGCVDCDKCVNNCSHLAVVFTTVGCIENEATVIWDRVTYFTYFHQGPLLLTKNHFNPSMDITWPLNSGMK